MASSPSSAAAAAVGRAVEEVRSAPNEHADVVAELFGRASTELRGGFAPAIDTFVGFFHAVDWKLVMDEQKIQDELHDEVDAAPQNDIATIYADDDYGGRADDDCILPKDGVLVKNEWTRAFEREFFGIGRPCSSFWASKWIQHERCIWYWLQLYARARGRVDGMQDAARICIEHVLSKPAKILFVDLEVFLCCMRTRLDHLIGHDNRIVGAPKMKPMGALNSGLTRLGDLVDVHSNQWIKEKVRSVLLAPDAHSILSMPTL